MTPLLLVLAAYLIGGIPFGYLLVRWTTGGDVRRAGSGNIGATNVFRTTSRAIGLLTLALDILKGWLAVWLMDTVAHPTLPWLCAAALAVMLGHCYPVFLRFQGGKGVASFVGAFLYLTPLPLLATAILFVITVAVSRHISLGSLAGALCFPFAVWLILHPPAVLVVTALLAGVLVIYRHRANLERLRAGTESVFSWSRRR